MTGNWRRERWTENGTSTEYKPRDKWTGAADNGNKLKLLLSGLETMGSMQVIYPFSIPCLLCAVLDINMDKNGDKNGDKHKQIWQKLIVFVVCFICLIVNRYTFLAESSSC